MSPSCESTGQPVCAELEDAAAGRRGRCGPSATSGAAADGRRALARQLRPRRAGLIAGALLGLAGGVLGLVQPLAAKRLVDDLGHGRQPLAAILAISALVLGGALFSALGQYTLERTAESVVGTARWHLADRLLRLRIAELERSDPGDLIARVTSDTTVLRQVTTQSLTSAATSTLVVLATVVVMGLLDLVLLAITLAVIAVIGAVVGAVAPRIGRATRQAQEAVGHLGAALERVLGAVRTVKACGAEEREAARLRHSVELARRTGVRAASWQAVSSTASAVAVQLSFLAVLGAGGARVASGAITVSTLVAFLLYLFALAPRVNQLVEAVGQLQLGTAAALRIGAVQQMATEPAQAPAGPPGQRTGTPTPTTAPRSAPAGVTFERVRFAYRPDLPEVHHEVTFALPAGGTTAFVGPSGAGKTTVFSLIERFHEPDAGQILVDGRNVRHWPLRHLRAAIGYVEQEAPVLAGTLRENLLLGAPDATEEQVREVLRRTRLEGVVARLPHGLDTPVGHRGSRLSGGERQRVAIARALLRRPRLLLLDEATSQLDASNEAALRETITDAARTTSVLVIAHRLSTVTTADRIVVMEAGRVRAVGSHTRLFTHDTLYRQLATTQLLTAAD